MNEEQKQLVRRLRDFSNQFVEETQGLLLQAANEIEALGTFVQDVADHGLRTDMHPTIIVNSEDGTSMYGALTSYFQTAEDNIRERAKKAME